MAGKLQEIFEHVIDLERGAREAYLASACGDDAALRAEVEALLRAHDGAAKFLASPTAASSADATIAAPIREGPGTRIGPYKLLQLIGEGGFGSVFMAEQEVPVTRRVALKIIKLGMDTRQVVARFEQERQALAMMDHPNIAKVLDAGATDTGRPFFVMELVKGDPIVEYCDKNNLSIDDRLELFAQVCNAVQHAHTKGIIHRDIKPSNILVSTQDGRPHTKVIDFGIAKATASKLTEKTLFTEHRALIGTPEYMSPEQAEGNLDIDTRTDVYSLSVLLYELLTGTTPFTGKELRSAAFGELQRIIREVEPPKPSTRLSNNTDTIASVAAKRHTEPKRLGTIIRGELDWIVMKALEKDRQRRYETANGLAMDIHRYLSGEAVVAAPPSTSYRFKKFVKRNRVMVSAGSAVGAALLLGVVAFAWQFKLASHQRDIAVNAQQAEAEQRKAAEAARAEAVAQQTEAEKQEAEAKKQAAIASAVVKFQSDMLSAVDPANLPKDPETGEPLKDTVTVVQALEAAHKAIEDGSLKDSPLVEAGVRTTIGDTFVALGRYEEAVPVLRRTLELRKANYPEGSLEIAQSMDRLAESLSLVSNFKEAVALRREALATRRQALPPGDPSVGTAMNNLAQTLLLQGAYEEAESILRESLAIQEQASTSTDKAGLARTYDNLSQTLTKQNKLDEAEVFMRKALQSRIAAYPPGHPEIALGQNNLATMLASAKKYGEAEQLYRESLAIRRATLPAQHPDIASTLSNLGNALRNQGKLAEAEPVYSEALAIKRAILPRGHESIATSLNGLGLLLKEMDKLDEAEPIYREALAIRRESLPAGHPSIATSLNNLAVLLKDMGKLDEAEPLYLEALAIRRDALPPGHPSIATSLNNLAVLLNEQNKLAEAEPVLREALEIRRANFPAESVEIASTLNSLAVILQEQGKHDQAEPLAREAAKIYRAKRPAGHESIASSLSNLARVQQSLGKTAEARANWDEAIAMLRNSSPDGSAQLARALWRSGSARLENHEAAAALPELEEAASMAQKFLKPDDTQLAECRETLAKCKEVLAGRGVDGSGGAVPAKPDENRGGG
ncbi:MAG TPA: serine/threonine-protein kinase [Phycisphaerales bacterium]|nr:serine/threonine-protein kinase [Phycisphaerales bacterium]